MLNNSKKQCADKDFIPNTKDMTYVIYFHLGKETEQDTEEQSNARFGTWESLATCFKIWDMDPRDFHFGLMRIWLKDNHIILIGVPESPYSIYKPNNVEPIHIPVLRQND